MSSHWLSAKIYNYSSGRKFCLELLRSGWADIFLEFFDLLKLNCRIRQEAQLKEERYIPALITNQPKKLKAIVDALILAERAEDSVVSTQIRKQLGQSFLCNREDKWLAEYFFASTTRGGLKKLNKGNAKEKVEDLIRLARLQEETGDLIQALRLLQQALVFTQDDELQIPEDTKLSVYLNIYKICMKIGNEVLDKERKNIPYINGSKTSESLKFFKEALEMAQLATSEELTAVASRDIGKVMLIWKNNKAAVKYITKYLVYCLQKSDDLNLCNCYLAFATAYDQMGDEEIMLVTLNRCKIIARQNSYAEQFISCCVILGQSATNVENYEKAYENFKDAFEVLVNNKTKVANYEETENFIRVLVGIAKAHLHFGAYVNVLRDNNIQKLMKWKDRKIDVDI